MLWQMHLRNISLGIIYLR